MQIQFTPCEPFYVKVRTMIGKERGPENQNGDIWADSDEVKYLEPLNSSKPPGQAEAVLHTLSEEIRLHLPEECALTFPEIVALHGTPMFLRT